MQRYTSGYPAFFPVVLLAALLTGVPSGAEAGPARTMKAFSVRELPSDDAKVSRFLGSLRDAGADTVILGPLGEGGLTKKRVPHLIFLAHQARLKVHFILPVRTDGEALRSHPEWEDRRYDLASGTLQPGGTLDVFQPAVLRYLAETVKNVASFTADGIVLGDDLFYEDTDGFGQDLLDAYRRKYGVHFEPRRAFLRIEKTDSGYRTKEYGESYEQFSRLKREQLVSLVKELRNAARSVNRDITIAVPIRFQGYRDQINALPVYSREVKAFRAAEPDFYWVVFPHREAEGLNYRDGMKAIARSATIISQAVPEACRAIMVLPLLNPEGRMLASTEIEESTDMAVRGGSPCIAYQTRHDRALPFALMQKLLKRD